MARLTDEERVVDHLLKVGAASPADIRRALSLAESDTKEILQRLASDGRAQHEGRGRGVRWSLVETRPVPPPVEASPVVEERAVPSEASAPPRPAPVLPQSVVNAALHPTGQCTCAGEGLCDWCISEPISELGDPAEPWPSGCARGGPECERKPCECVNGHPGGAGHPGPVAATADALPSGGVEAVAPGGGGKALSAREAARRCHPLDGSDAQALEGALQITERERDEARRERDAARSELDQARRERDLAQAQAVGWKTERDAAREQVAKAREETAGWKARAERALAERDEAQRALQSNRDLAAQANARHDEAAAEVKRLEGALDQLCDKLEAVEAVLEVVYKALGLTKETATDEAITTAIAGLMANHSSVTLSWDSPRLVATADEVATAAKTIAGLAASPASTDRRIPYEVLEGRLAHYRGAWCDLAAAVTGTPTDPAGEHGELEVGSVLAMAQRQRADLDTAADLPSIIDRLVAERDEARAQRDEVERRAEATNDALWKLRKRAHRKLERARDRLAKAQNGLDVIESVPLASDPIPF